MRLTVIDPSSMQRQEHRCNRKHVACFHKIYRKKNINGHINVDESYSLLLFNFHYSNVYYNRRYYNIEILNYDDVSISICQPFVINYY